MTIAAGSVISNYEDLAKGLDVVDLVGSA